MRLRPRHAGAAKAETHLDAFDRVERHQRGRQRTLETSIPLCVAAETYWKPLGQHLNDSATLKASDYYTQSLAAFTYNGTLQCIPQNISSLAVYYNKDLFTRYNVPVPAASWTWNNFLSAAQALTKDTDGNGSNDIYGMGVDTQLIRLAPFIWSNGGELVDNYDKPTKLLLDTPQAQ